jgi:hypothetical protein
VSSAAGRAVDTEAPADRKVQRECAATLGRLYGLYDVEKSTANIVGAAYAGIKVLLDALLSTAHG